MRIELPEGEDPVAYTMMRMGSPKLLQNRLESWNVQLFNDSSLTPREREVARIRCAYQMSCERCLGFRAGRDLPGFCDEEIPDELYEHVLEHATWPGYTERERLAIEFCERFMLDYREMVYDDAFWKRLQTSFTETEIADLCLLAGMWDSSAKMFHLLIGMEDSCAIPAVHSPQTAEEWMGTPHAANG